eukprot:CAMPEP_0183381828 /NCGR_PEP_ID=MMETSP0164_2-20130417/126637_1 /TAXON_ID=221442 /ORGANISM="Coccolithus pelagicus ssp braarudi, Strain PLY182g" /LENGTH=72 /DNA_ID=CAMNT_0025559441 /DNA_START=156 /DNA_END=374 /DNA_ORIENTATION=+
MTSSAACGTLSETAAAGVEAAGAVFPRGGAFLGAFLFTGSLPAGICTVNLVEQTGHAARLERLNTARQTEHA